MQTAITQYIPNAMKNLSNEGKNPLILIKIFYEAAYEHIAQMCEGVTITPFPPGSKIRSDLSQDALRSYH